MKKSQSVTVLYETKLLPNLADFCETRGIKYRATGESRNCGSEELPAWRTPVKLTAPDIWAVVSNLGFDVEDLDDLIIEYPNQARGFWEHM